MKQGLALFDFDGTITSKDSLLEFIKFASGPTRLLTAIAIFSPFIFYYAFIKKDGGIAKKKVLSFLYKGKSEAEMRELGDSFAKKVIPAMLIPKAISEIQKHIKAGRRVVVVSASLEIWLKPWTDSMGIELLCTKMQFENGKFSGRFANINCNGEEKANRVKALMDLKDYGPIYAYGNSSGDDALLALADYPHYRLF